MNQEIVTVKQAIIAATTMIHLILDDCCYYSLIQVFFPPLSVKDCC